MTDVVIAAYRRSPFHFAGKGDLAGVRPDEMVAQVVRALVEATGVDPATVEDLVLGCAFPEGEQGLNMAKLVAFLSGMAEGTAGVTVNRFCGSSMQSVHQAAGAIRMGAGDAFVCAGVESMSRVPMMGFNPMPHPGLAKDFPQAYISMGETAENVARLHQVTRRDQEQFAARSHQKATAAQEAGKLAEEIVPITGPKGKTVKRDGCIRPDTTAEGLSTLKPAFRQDGTVTAGNACPLNDGAAATLIMSDTKAAELGLKPRARIITAATWGNEPEYMGVAPIGAIRKALERASMSIGDVDVYELNEAFAAQVLPIAEEIGFDMDKLNPHGGAIALGHPFGMTGARIMTTLLNDLETRDGTIGLETMCAAQGQGQAMLVERLN